MSNEKRLDHVETALGARARAAMFLGDYKAGLNPDPSAVRWRSDEEKREFWRLVEIVYFCNDELAEVVLLLREQVEQEALRVHWLETVRLYSSHLWIVRRFLAESVREPVTESEVKKRTASKRGFDVHPDREHEEVERIRRDRRFIDELLQGWDVKSNGAGTATDAVDCLSQVARDHLCTYWNELHAVDDLVTTYGRELGEDPLRPALRACLDEVRREILRIKDDLVAFVGPCELPGDHDDAMATAREVAHRALA